MVVSERGIRSITDRADHSSIDIDQPSSVCVNMTRKRTPSSAQSSVVIFVILLSCVLLAGGTLISDF